MSLSLDLLTVGISSISKVRAYNMHNEVRCAEHLKALNIILAASTSIVCLVGVRREP